MRVEGWERLLNDHITEAYRKPFAWGEQDCALWCAEWVSKATGRDLGQPWRGKYKTETAAIRLKLKKGFSGVESIADEHLESTPVTLAQRGDVMLHPDGPLGLCNGKHSFFLTEGSVTMTKGIIDAGQLELIVGSLAGLFGLAWSIWQKKKAK